jgi:hypothetical protein
MTDSAANQTPVPATPARHELAASIPAVRSAARSFWWIAGLSLVNIVLLQTGSGAWSTRVFVASSRYLRVITYIISD